MNSDTPNFIFNNINALVDMGCVIANELPELSPKERFEEVKVLGRNGSLHESYGDYDTYDLPVSDITIPYENLSQVKKWLRGRGKLITHNDINKYRDCICMMDSPIEFENEWGVFYTFSVTFRCQPFKRKVSESPIKFTTRLKFYDTGDEKANPLIELTPNSDADVSITLNNKLFKIKNTTTKKIIIDSENGKTLQGTKQMFTEGDWPKVKPGENTLIAINVKSGNILQRSVFY